VDVEVKYYAAAREATGKRSEVIILLTGSTVKELIHALAERYGKPLSVYMLGEGGEPTDYLTYFVDGVNVHSLRGFDTELKNGDMVVIAPPIVGG
jgi:molybdopterin synthase sulfur carrier subunit